MNWPQSEINAYYERRAKEPLKPVSGATYTPILLPKAKGVQKHTPGELNKTEGRYRDHLETRKIAREILWYGFEVVTFKLAPDLRYTPDFLVLMKDLTLECHECKAMTKTGKLLITDDGRVKLIMAAELFPIVFRRMAYEPNTGEWIEQEIGRKAA